MLAIRSVLLVLSLTLTAASAAAQHTGGSFGSAHDNEDHSGSRRRRSGGSDDHWDWEPTGSSGTARERESILDRHARERREEHALQGRGRSSGPGIAQLGEVLIAFILYVLPVVLVLYLLVKLIRTLHESQAMRAASEEVDWNASWNDFSTQPVGPTPLVSMQRITLAFAPEARRVVQFALRNASGQELVGNDARAQVLDGLLGLFQTYAHAVAYAHVTSSMLNEDEARNNTRALANDLRARYQADTVGPNQTSAPALRAREEEGDGLVVVSVLLTRDDAVLMQTPRTRAEVEALLTRLRADRSPLWALDVIWSPSEEADRLSSYELERIYGELVRLAEATNFGAMTCPACQGALPRELTSCPHCGRPVDRSPSA